MRKMPHREMCATCGVKPARSHSHFCTDRCGANWADAYMGASQIEYCESCGIVYFETGIPVKCDNCGKTTSLNPQPREEEICLR